MRKIILLLLSIFILSVAAFAQQADGAKPARVGHFQIAETETGKFHYVLRSSNGQEILKGYQFGSDQKAREAMEKVKLAAVDETNFDPRNEKEQWYFFLKGVDGKAIGRSENYATEAAMRRGIESVKKTAPGANPKN